MSGVINKHGQRRGPADPAALLSCIWLLGIFLGLALASFSTDYVAPLLVKIVPSIIYTPIKLLIAILPFLLSVYAVSYTHRNWLFLICGLKASWFSFCCFLLCMCYGQAGWLACELFMFFEIFTLPCLFFYWVRHLSIQEGFPVHMHIVFFVLVAVIAIVDYRIMTPYAAKFGFFLEGKGILFHVGSNMCL